MGNVKWEMGGVRTVGGEIIYSSCCVFGVREAFFFLFFFSSRNPK